MFNDVKILLNINSFYRMPNNLRVVEKTFNDFISVKNFVMSPFNKRSTKYSNNKTLLSTIVRSNWD